MAFRNDPVGVRRLFEREFRGDGNLEP